MSQVDSSKIKVALHIHTLYSACSETILEEMEKYCLSKGISVVGITDHDTISGALALKSIVKNLRVIIGEEIKTKQGEITGLFLKKEVAPGLDAEETCLRIKDQGGLVYIPHPFDPFKFHRLTPKALTRVLDLVDIIEVFNAKANFPFFNPIAAKFAMEHGKVGAAGSDAHFLQAISLCTNEMKDFETPQDFLENLSHARLITEHIYPCSSWWVGIKNVLKGEGHVVKRFGRRDRHKG